MKARQRITHLAFKKPTPRAMGYYFYLAGVLGAICAAGILIATEAQAKPGPPSTVATAHTSY